MRQYPGTWVPWSLRGISLPDWVLTSHSHRCWPSINRLLLTVGPGGNSCTWVGLGVVRPQACGERALCRGSDGGDHYPRGHWPGLRWWAYPGEGLLHPGAGQGVTDGAQRPTQRVVPLQMLAVLRDEVTGEGPGLLEQSAGTGWSWGHAASRHTGQELVGRGGSSVRWVWLCLRVTGQRSKGTGGACGH